eukprot:7655494-Pyramimonas_sp.AAC.1
MRSAMLMCAPLCSAVLPCVVCQPRSCVFCRASGCSAMPLRALPWFCVFCRVPMCCSMLLRVMPCFCLFCCIPAHAVLCRALRAPTCYAVLLCLLPCSCVFCRAHVRSLGSAVLLR